MVGKGLGPIHILFQEQKNSCNAAACRDRGFWGCKPLGRWHCLGRGLTVHTLLWSWCPLLRGNHSGPISCLPNSLCGQQACLILPWFMPLFLHKPSSLEVTILAVLSAWYPRTMIRPCLTQFRCHLCRGPSWPTNLRHPFFLCHYWKLLFCLQSAPHPPIER